MYTYQGTYQRIAKKVAPASAMHPNVTDVTTTATTHVSVNFII